MLPLQRLPVVPEHEKQRVLEGAPGPGPRLQLRHGPAEEGVHLLQLGCHDGVPHVEGVAGMVDPQEMPHEDVPVPLPPSRAPRELTAGVMLDARVHRVQVLHVQGGEGVRVRQQAWEEPLPGVIPHDVETVAVRPQLRDEAVLGEGLGREGLREVHEGGQ